MESFREKITHEQPTSETMPIVEVNPVQTEDKRFLFTEPLPTLKEAEKILIEAALRRSNGNQTIAAQLLGLSRRALNNRLRRADK